MADQDGGAEYGGRGEYSVTRSSDHSAALAEKLLQGWALLQEHCPQCFTPLVRNRQRKMYCVACSQWVVSQTEAAEQLARERVEMAGGENGPSQPLPEPASTGPSSSLMNSDETGRQQPNTNPPAPNSPSTRALQNTAGAQCIVRQSSNTGDMRSTLLIPKLNYHPKTVEQVLPNITSILAHKLEEIGNALLASEDVHDMRMLMSALRECAQALEALKAL